MTKAEAKSAAITYNSAAGAIHYTDFAGNPDWAAIERDYGPFDDSDGD